jgi:hypothetical protein
MSEHSRSRCLLWLLILAVITVGVYYPGLHAGYYADDFQFIFEQPATKILHYFTHTTPYNGFYRPMQASVLAATQAAVGWETWPIRAINLAMHTLLAWMVYRYMASNGFSLLQGMLGSVFMAVSQANASAILGNDTQSQVSGALFGCLSLWLLDCHARSHPPSENLPPPPAGYYIVSVVSFTLALISKETSSCFFLMALAVIFLSHSDRSRLFRPLGSAIRLYLPYVVMMAAYLLVRWAVGSSQPAIGEERYEFHIGFNIIRNYAQCIVAGLIPVSSVSAFILMAQKNMAGLALIGAATLVFVALIVYGLIHSPRRRLILLLMAFAMLSLVPVVFLNHVGELYMYNALPFLSVLVGIGFGEVLARNRRRAAVAVVSSAAIMMIFVSHALATQSKATMMKANGDRAAALLPQVTPYVRELPPNGIIYLLNPPSDEVEYSIYVMKGFHVFSEGEQVLLQVAGRKDAAAAVIDDRRALDSVMAARPGTVLTYDNTMKVRPAK